MATNVRSHSAVAIGRAYVHGARSVHCQWSAPRPCWGDARHHLHPRSRRQRPALPPVAHRRQLGRLPPAPAPPRARTCSTSGAARAPSPATWPGRWPRAGWSGSMPPPRSWSRPGRRPPGPVRTMTFEVADLFALPFADDSFDVVHAHQVLQHVADPVAALVEMRRVCRPGGVVAARDGDYPAFTFAPAEPDLVPVHRRLRRADPGQPGPLGRGPAPARLGPCRRIRRRGGVGVGVVLRHRGGPGVVGRPVGRPVRRARARSWPRSSRRTGSPTGPTSRPSGRAGAGGRRRPTAGSPCSTARSWPRREAGQG